MYLSLAGLAACGSNPPSPSAATPESTPTVPGTPVAPIRIGLALGGGAVKGFAHIGVIKMLEANGLAPAVVSGTSAGSVVGALYAGGMNAFELQEKAVALDETKIRDLQLSSGGLLVGQKLEDYVNEQVGRKPLEQLAKPFVAVSTRLEDGERTVFARGNTGRRCVPPAAFRVCSSPWPSASSTSSMAASPAPCPWTPRASWAPIW